MGRNDPTANPAHFLREHARRLPDKIALAYPVRTSQGRVVYEHLTYQQMDALSDRAAYALQQAGFSRGDKTVFMVKSGPQLFTLSFALFKIGAVPVIVDPGMGIRRMLHCYAAVGAKAFIGIPAATLFRLMARKKFSAIRSSVTVVGGKIWGESKLLRNIATSTPFPERSCQSDDLLLIAFTTGSTGPAKAVEYTHTMTVAMTEEIRRHTNLSEDDVQLLTLPLFGIIGMMLGNTCVLAEMDPTKPADVNPDYLVQAIERYAVTSMFGSPSLLNALGRYGQERKVRLTTLRMVSCGGAPMTLSTMKLFRKMLSEKATFETTWGATEGLPLSSINVDTVLSETQAGMSTGQGACIGKPVGRVDVKVMKVSEGPVEEWSEELACPGGSVGELLVKGPNVSHRYHQDEVSNRHHKVRQGGDLWHRTGDLGWLDEKGRIWFCGRKDHRVELPERNIVLYSVQVEGVVNRHPSVYRSALVRVNANNAGQINAGQINAGQINAGQINAGQINAGQINAGQINAGQINVPVVVVELKPEAKGADSESTRREILALMKRYPVSDHIEHLLFHPSLPVDIRHNAKIDRKALGTWASSRIKNPRKMPGTGQLEFNRAMLVPIVGWCFVVLGSIWPPRHWAGVAAWWAVLFLSVVVHGAQVFIAVPAGRCHGFSAFRSFLYTMAFGVTWWKNLHDSVRKS